MVAVDDLSFTVPEGGITGLIGPNGAGKTTTMDAICGFADCGGTIELSGRTLHGLLPHRRAALGLGRTFQGTGLYEDLTVEENVVVGQQVAKDRGPGQVTAILSALGVAALGGRRVSELSQGQRQLVSVAKALAGQPRLLLLDEPAAGLDSSESLWLAERLRGVRDTGVTILLIDHDMSLVLGSATRSTSWTSAPSSRQGLLTRSAGTSAWPPRISARPTRKPTLCRRGTCRKPTLRRPTHDRSCRT